MISIVAVLLLGTTISLVVGHLLQRAGRPFLDDVLQDTRVSGAVARLLAVMFHLIALGAVALVGTLRFSGFDWLYETSLKLGIVLLILGAAHGLTLLGLLRIKKRRRRQLLEERMAESLRPPPPAT